MRGLLGLVCGVGMVLGLSAGVALLGQPAEAAPAATGIDIVVSPSTIVLGPQGVWVTVHADLRYSSQYDVALAVNGGQEIPATLTKPDTRGDLVAKFRIGTVKDQVEPPSATLTLSVVTPDGTRYVGSDTVQVKEGGPR